MADGQDSPISGAEMLAFESGACSVTEGHRAHRVCGAERTFEPVADTNGKRKSATVQAVCKANDRPVSPKGSRTTRKCCALSCLLFPATLCANTIERKTKKLKIFFRLRVADGQDSPISGAEMLAFESGACSVTEGHRAHNVCGAERTFEPVADTNGKRKTLLNSRVFALVEATGLEPVTSRM